MLDGFVGYLVYFSLVLLNRRGFHLAMLLEPRASPALASPSLLLPGLKGKCGAALHRGAGGLKVLLGLGVCPIASSIPSSGSLFLHGILPVHSGASWCMAVAR